jgi:hypothetical protein
MGFAVEFSRMLLQVMLGSTFCLLYARFLVSVLFNPEQRKRHFPSKHHLTFNGLYGVISQKIELFITTAVRTSNPAQRNIWPHNTSGGLIKLHSEELRDSYYS